MSNHCGRRRKSSLSNLCRASSGNHDVANPSRRSISNNCGLRRDSYNPGVPNHMAPSPPSIPAKPRPPTNRPTQTSRSSPHNVRAKVRQVPQPANRHSHNSRNCTDPIHALLRRKNPTNPATRHPSQHIHPHPIRLHPRRPPTHNPTPHPNHTVININIIFISGSKGSKQH